MPMILAIFCTLIVVSYELHDRVKLAAEESGKNKYVYYIRSRVFRISDSYVPAESYS